MKPDDLNDNDSLEIALLDARMWITKSDMATQRAERETQLGGGRQTINTQNI